MKSHKFILKNYENFRQVNQSPTNNSVTKQSHAFAKSPRFSPRRPTCPEYSYDRYTKNIPQYSGVSIGYGKKSDFTQDMQTCAPGVGKYYLKHFCDENINKKFTIGLGRKEVGFRSYISKQIERNPGANSYSVNSETHGDKSPRYSFRKRTKVINKSLTIEPQNQNPGPGDYGSNMPEIYQTKKYSISKTRRFDRLKTDSPGPGYYDELNSAGKSIVSTSHIPPGGSFTRSIKKSLIDDAIKIKIRLPGPGSYRHSSEFGYYDEY